TRQNATSVAAALSWLQVGAILVLPVIAESGPAGTSTAELMSVSGRFSVTRSAQAIGVGACFLLLLSALTAVASAIAQTAKANLQCFIRSSCFVVETNWRRATAGPRRHARRRETGYRPSRLKRLTARRDCTCRCRRAGCTRCSRSPG